MYSKHSKTWTVVTMKKAKQYSYISTLLENIIKEKLRDVKPLRRKRQVDDSDPVNIASTIAPVAPPPTEAIAMQKRTRYQQT